LRWDIELKQSFIVGDKATDVEAGINAGVTPIMVATGYGAEQRELVPSTTRYVADLLEAAQLITGIFRH
jgi:D-glycero-D-manno-heptose 1,7-bisphosphate phosphatase